MTEMTQAADTAAMRAEADQLNASVREDNRSLYERQRRAAQLAYEADLLDDAELCRAEWHGASSRLPLLDAAVQEAIAAERAAEDRMRPEDRQLSRVRSEMAKADPGDGDAQERLALRVHARQGAVSACARIVAAARDKRLEAQQALSQWQAHVGTLEAEKDAAEAKAANPGTAPNMPAFAPGVSKVSDLDDETRAALALVVMTLGSQSLSSAPAPAPGRGRRTTNGEWAAQDPAGWRHIRRGTSMFAIPPAPGH